MTPLGKHMHQALRRRLHRGIPYPIAVRKVADWPREPLLTRRGTPQP